MTVISGSYNVESGFETTLKNSISASQTANIIINKVLFITVGVLNLDPDTAKEEWIGFGGRTDNGDGTCTLTDVTRGLNKIADTFTGNAVRCFSHSGGACKVVLTDYHSLFNLKANVDRANTFTADQTIGTGKVIKLTDTDVTIRRDGDDLKLKDLNQAEVTLSQLAASAGLNDKAGISVADTTPGYLNPKITVGEGLAKEITDTGADEKLNLKLDTATTATAQLFVANNASGISTLETSAITGAIVADKQSLTFATDNKLGLTTAAGLNESWLFAGIAKQSGGVGDTINYTPTGPIAIVPAFTIAQRDKCREWAGVFSTTTNTATDTVNNTTQWRGQTFVPSAGHDNISSVYLKLTTAAFTGTLQVLVYATTAGVPSGAILTTFTLALAASTASSTNQLFSGTLISLTPGTTYALVLKCSSYSSGTFAWDYNNASVYADGTSLTSSNSGGAWTIETTFDRGFSINWKGIIGEDVFLSDTSGALSLVPGQYATCIGKAISLTQVVLSKPKKRIYATYSFNTNISGETVDTVFYIGFLPNTVRSFIFSQFNNASASTGEWLNGVAGSSRSNTGGNYSASIFHASNNNIGQLYLPMGANFGCAFSVIAFTSNTITIRRTSTAHTTQVAVSAYFFIED